MFDDDFDEKQWVSKMEDLAEKLSDELDIDLSGLDFDRCLPNSVDVVDTSECDFDDEGTYLGDGCDGFDREDLIEELDGREYDREVLEKLPDAFLACMYAEYQEELEAGMEAMLPNESYDEYMEHEEDKL